MSVCSAATRSCGLPTALIILARKYAENEKDDASIAQQNTLKDDIFVSSAFPERSAASHSDQYRIEIP